MTAEAPAAAPGRQAGVVTGLAAEAKVLKRALAVGAPAPSPKELDEVIVCAAARPERARRLAERLLESGATALMSFGVAGGLDPARRAGDLVVAEEVILPGGGRVATDAAWRAGVSRAGVEAGLETVTDVLLGSDSAIVESRHKQRLYHESGAVAVDMESHAVAEVAASAGVALLVVRAVADPAVRPLPSAVLGSTAPDGRSRGGLVAARLCLRPWQLASVMRLGRDFRLALDSLERVARHGRTRLLGGF